MSIHDKTIVFGDNALPPQAWLDFAKRYPDGAIISVAGPLADTDDLQNQLAAVNERVNAAFPADLSSPGWQLWPPRGHCTDYVVTKRAELLKAGLPSSCLLIAEVVTPDDEPHAVLVVRTTGGDYVLDNRNPMIYLWNGVGYRWLRMQTPANPNFWKGVVL